MLITLNIYIHLKYNFFFALKVISFVFSDADFGKNAQKILAPTQIENLPSW